MILLINSWPTRLYKHFPELMIEYFFVAVRSFLLSYLFVWAIFIKFLTDSFIDQAVETLSFVIGISYLVILGTKPRQFSLIKIQKRHVKVLLPAYLAWVSLLLFDFRLIFNSTFFFSLLILIDFRLMADYGTLNLKPFWIVGFMILAPVVFHQLAVHTFYCCLVAVVHQTNPLPFLPLRLMLIDEKSCELSLKWQLREKMQICMKPP